MLPSVCVLTVSSLVTNALLTIIYHWAHANNLKEHNILQTGHELINNLDWWKSDQLAINNSHDYHVHPSCFPEHTLLLSLGKDTLQTYYQQIQQIKTKKVAKPYPVIGNVNSQCVVKMIHDLHKLFTLEKQGLHL